MSLLNRSFVALFPALRTVNDLGEDTISWGEQVNVLCSPQWRTATQENSIGLAPDAQLIVLAKDWPGSEQCRFWWDGKTFEQIGATRHYYGSPRTEHDEIQAKLVSTRMLQPNPEQKDS